MKTRLTITLSSSTLAQVDQLIDKKTIRNRSHAIEHLLEQSLQPTISTAILLAGGKEKAKAVKPLIMLNNKPLILYTIENLRKYGISKLIIATNRHGREIEKLLGDGSKHNMQIEYEYEAEPLGTAGAIKNVARSIGKLPFFVLIGDVLTTIDLHDLSQFHAEQQALVTMAVKPMTTKASYDSVSIQGTRVITVQPNEPDQTASLVNAGVYIMEPEVLKHIPNKKGIMLETEVFPKLAETDKVVAFPFQGAWFEVTSEESYAEAIKSVG